MQAQPCGPFRSNIRRRKRGDRLFGLGYRSIGFIIGHENRTVARAAAALLKPINSGENPNEVVSPNALP